MAEDYESLKREIESLKTQIGELREQIKGATSAASSFVSKIGEGNNLFQSMVGSVKSLYTNLLEFSTNLQDQYKLGEQLAKSFKQTSVNIGIGTQNQKLFELFLLNFIRFVANKKTIKFQGYLFIQILVIFY